MDNIIINENVFLSAPNLQDAEDITNHLQEKEISDNTLLIPYPYSISDAQWFIDFIENSAKKIGKQLNWAIRNKEGMLIGMVGFKGDYLRGKHRDEVGYWLAKPYWGKGIMTAVVKKICDYAIKEHGYVRIEAPIFTHNIASQKVVERCGFINEGLVRKAYHKNGAYIDGVMYALVV